MCSARYYIEFYKHKVSLPLELAHRYTEFSKDKVLHPLQLDRKWAEEFQKLK